MSLILIMAAVAGVLAVNLKNCLMTPENSCLTSIKTIKQVVNFLPVNSNGQTILSKLERVLVLEKYKSYFLGIGKETNYVILLQNDNEMRANGGFSGSYAVINAKNGKFEIRFEDIYTPDGQLIGHVDPPEPIQRAFKQGGLRLRDADYEPDFPTSATAISWFFEKGKEVKPDVLATLSFSGVKRVAKILGPIEVPEYGFTLDETNLYSFLQGKSEIDFFPGSTQKKDAISSVGKATMQKMLELSWTQRIEILGILLEELDRGNSVIYSSHPEVETIIKQLGWAGELEAKDGDSLAIVEVNLGANKANCCVDRQTRHEIVKEGEMVRHKIVMNFANNSEFENPKPPTFYGGNYINYLRFYLPKELTNLVVENGGEPVSRAEKFGFSEVGFFHLTKAGSTSRVEVAYEIPIPEVYKLSIFKQNGLRSSPQVIDLFGKQITTQLEGDFYFE